VRAAALLAGIVLVGIGISNMVAAELGVAPADVLSTGGAEQLGIGVGTMGWLAGMTYTAIAWLLRRPPSWGTVIGGVLVGIAINVGLAILPEPEALVWRIPMLVGGLALVYLGISLGVASNLGTGPLELLMLAFGDRGIRVDVARWGIEATLLAVGLLLGGQIGAGTVLFLVLTGPVLARTLPPVVRFMGTEVLERPTGIDA
jgi:uncharacterized membrane protein YczE